MQDIFFKELKCAEMRKRNISLAAENRQVNEKLASLDAQLEIYMHSEAEVSQMLRQEQNKVIGEFDKFVPYNLYRPVSNRISLSVNLNSHLTRWFSTTNDPFMCTYQVLNEVVSQKFFKRLPLKLNFATFGDISSNRKLNFQSPLNRK